MKSRNLSWFIVLVLPLPLLERAAAQSGWPEVFDPLQLLTLNLEMDPRDWSTIQHDQTFSIQVPALLWADGEDQLLVTVRRKSSDPLNNGGGFIKVSLKIDVNALVNGQKWHDLTKLSPVPACPANLPAALIPCSGGLLLQGWRSGAERSDLPPANN